MIQGALEAFGWLFVASFDHAGLSENIAGHG
jgi:hypothetical protein